MLRAFSQEAAMIKARRSCEWSRESPLHSLFLRLIPVALYQPVTARRNLNLSSHTMRYTSFCLLLALLLMPVADGLAVALLEVSADLLSVCWSALQGVAYVSERWSMPPLYPGFSALALAVLGVVLYLLPVGPASAPIRCTLCTACGFCRHRGGESLNPLHL